MIGNHLVKRAASILLLICFLALGTGTVQYLHNLQHQAEDAREDAIARASGQATEHHHHDESNCEVHAQLVLAFFFDGWTPLLMLLGLLVGRSIVASLFRIPRLTPIRIDCRGPPVISTSR
jgi:hypothetical protein